VLQWQLQKPQAGVEGEVLAGTVASSLTPGSRSGKPHSRSKQQADKDRDGNQNRTLHDAEKTYNGHRQRQWLALYSWQHRNQGLKIDQLK